MHSWFGCNELRYGLCQNVKKMCYLCYKNVHRGLQNGKNVCQFLAMSLPVLVPFRPSSRKTHHSLVDEILNFCLRVLCQNYLKLDYRIEQRVIEQ